MAPEDLAPPTGIRSPDPETHRESLYEFSYPVTCFCVHIAVKCDEMNAVITNVPIHLTPTASVNQSAGVYPFRVACRVKQYGGQQLGDLE